MQQNGRLRLTTLYTGFLPPVPKIVSWIAFHGAILQKVEDSDLKALVADFSFPSSIALDQTSSFTPAFNPSASPPP